METITDTITVIQEHVPQVLAAGTALVAAVVAFWAALRNRKR